MNTTHMPSDNSSPKPPRVFCWTRFGTEAGQPIESIFARKEQERRANGGVFLWGIGNSVAPSVAPLLEETDSPEVVFSPIKSPARECDSRPSHIAVWSEGVGYDGEPFDLPAGSLVTSHVSGSRKRRHYALVCRSQQRLRFKNTHASIDFRALSNLKSGNPLGASQVTAIVRRIDRADENRKVYPICLVTELVYPYVVEFRRSDVLDAADLPIDSVIKRAWTIQRGRVRRQQRHSPKQLHMFS